MKQKLALLFTVAVASAAVVPAAGAMPQSVAVTKPADVAAAETPAHIWTVQYYYRHHHRYYRHRHYERR